MNTIKFEVGQTLEFIGDEIEKKVYHAEVRGVCGEIVFLRDIIEVDGKVATKPPYFIWSCYWINTFTCVGNRNF